MPPDQTSITFSRCLTWTAKARSAKRVSATADTAMPSANIRMCLFLIYYFTLCDTILKFFPLGVAIVLRYLPEAVLYLFVFVLLMKKWRIVSFPLFLPLCACALTMTISGILNSSSIFWVMGDFRIYFRFVAFTYIGWRTTVAPQRITQFIKGFLGLTIIELIVGGLELIGGSETRTFFSPVLGLISGAPAVRDNTVLDTGSWIFGTLQDYNQFGMFMTLSCVLALALYFMKGSRRHLWLAFACALAVVLSFSRHSLLLLVIALGIFLPFQRKRILTSSKLRRSVVIFACGCALIVLGGSFSSALRERVTSVLSPEVMAGDQAANIRLYMTLELTPRFLNAYPLFGQGPIAPSDAVQFGETDSSQGPTLKAAPDVPGWVTFFFTDVIWVMVLGLYGCFGLAAFGYVFWSIAAAANRIRKEKPNAEGVALAQAGLVAVVLVAVSGLFSLEMVARDTVPVFWFLAGMVFSLAAKPLSKMQVLHH